MFRLFLLLSLACFIVSLCLPVYAGEEGKLGVFAFFGGWIVGVNDLPTAVSWLGNVMYVFAVIFILKRKKPRPLTATFFAVLAIVFGSAIFASGKIFIGMSETLPNLALGTAIYPWMASFALMALAGIFKRRKLKAAQVLAADQTIPAEQ